MVLIYALKLVGNQVLNKQKISLMYQRIQWKKVGTLVSLLFSIFNLQIHNLQCSKFCLFLQLAEELLRKETLSHDEVAALIGPPPHGKKHLIGPVEFELSLNQDAGAIDKPQQPKPSQGNKDSNELFASSNV